MSVTKLYENLKGAIRVIFYITISPRIKIEQYFHPKDIQHYVQPFMIYEIGFFFHSFASSQFLFSSGVVN